MHIDLLACLLVIIVIAVIVVYEERVSHIKPLPIFLPPLTVFMFVSLYHTNLLSFVCSVFGVAALAWLAASLARPEEGVARSSSLALSRSALLLLVLAVWLFWF